MAGRAAATARALSYAVPGAWAVRRRLSKRRHGLLMRVIAANRLNVQRTRLLPAPVASRGFPGYFLSSRRGGPCRDSGV